MRSLGMLSQRKYNRTLRFFLAWLRLSNALSLLFYILTALYINIYTSWGCEFLYWLRMLVHVLVEVVSSCTGWGWALLSPLLFFILTASHRNKYASCGCNFMCCLMLSLALSLLFLILTALYINIYAGWGCNLICWFSLWDWSEIEHLVSLLISFSQHNI